MTKLSVTFSCLFLLPEWEGSFRLHVCHKLVEIVAQLVKCCILACAFNLNC